MTRQKKTRKTGPLAPGKQPFRLLDREAAETKGRKSKGHRPGNRQNVATQKSKPEPTTAATTDSRFGSKRPVQLLQPGQEVTKPAEASKPSKSAPSPTAHEAAQAELQALEQDQKLQHLIEQLDAGVELSASDLAYVDERTERFNQLAELLGLELDDDDDWEFDEDEHD